MRTAFAHPELSVDVALDALTSAGLALDAARPCARTVLDTFDGRLHGAGLHLEARHRPDAELVLWSDDGAPPAHLAGGWQPRWPQELPVGPLRARLREVTQERALLPLLHLASTVRTGTVLDRRGKSVVGIEVHEHLRAGDLDLVPSWAVELNPRVGHDGAAEDLARRLRRLDLQPHDGGMPAVAALAAGVSLSGSHRSPTVPLSSGDAALDGYRRVLANLAVTIDDNLEGTVEDVDPEFLHDLRVAVRRTRSVLGEAKGVMPRDVRDHHREAFRWLGQLTGPARDLDVYVLGWDAYVSPLRSEDREHLGPVLEALAGHRRVAHERLRDALRSERAITLLDGWRRWLADLDVDTDRTDRLGDVVTARIAAAQHTVLRDGRAIRDDSPGERLHDLRKDAKRLRYLLECFGSLFPPKAHKAVVAHLKALQENLGDHQDAEVQLHELRLLAHDLHDQVGTDVLLAMGRLGDHFERRRQRQRDVFAARFAAYDTKANRRALDDLLRAGVGR